MPMQPFITEARNSAESSDHDNIRVLFGTWLGRISIAQNTGRQRKTVYVH